jgi:hypothetical protein
MAAFRASRTANQRPTYADWPYQLFTQAHRALQKEECDAILDSIAEDRDHERRTLYLDTEFKKIPALLHETSG